jgi:hypothetical protein
MADLLAASMVVVVLYCLTRAFVPSFRCAHHRRDVDAWHVAMAGVMAAMLLVPSGRAFSVLALCVFVAGLGWALSHGFRRTTRAAYLRLAVGCAAMTVMLLPAATASAASTASANAPTTPGGIHHMDQAMPAMAQAGGDGATGSSGLVPPTILLELLLAALGVVLVVRLLGSARRAGPLSVRRDAGCDVAMAAAMGYMLVLMI